MNEFREILEAIVLSERFGKSLREIAQYAGVDHTMLARVLTDERGPTSQFVGRLCAALPAAYSAQLLKAYLDDIIAETRSTEPLHVSPEGENQRATWRPPLSDIAINLECTPLRKVASVR